MNSDNTSRTRALLKGYAEVNTSQKLKKICIAMKNVDLVDPKPANAITFPV